MGFVVFIGEIVRFDLFFCAIGLKELECCLRGGGRAEVGCVVVVRRIKSRGGENVIFFRCPQLFYVGTVCFTFVSRGRGRLPS